MNPCQSDLLTLCKLHVREEGDLYNIKTVMKKSGWKISLLLLDCCLFSKGVCRLQQGCPVKVTQTNLSEFHPRATSSLSCRNTPRNLEGKAAPRSVDVCVFVRICNRRKMFTLWQRGAA